MTTKEAMEVGANFVAFTLTKSVALSAAGLEEVGTLLCVTYFPSAITALMFKRFQSMMKISKGIKAQRGLRYS